jgi:hypothetical protein
MKTPTLTRALLAGAVTLLVSTLAASADVLTADNPDMATTDSTIAVGSGGVLGYFFAATVPTAGGSQADISSYTNAPFVTSVTSPDGGFNGGSSDSTISVGGTSYYTGVDFSGSGSSTYQDIAKIQLATSGTIPTFKLGILTGATGTDFENDDLYQLTLYTSGGTAVNSTPLQVNNSPDDARPTSDDFFYATVSGAATGDYLELTVARNNAMNDGVYATGPNIVFGGLTISSATTPEPSTFALMFAGLGTLVLVARLRRSKA